MSPAVWADDGQDMRAQLFYVADDGQIIYCGTDVNTESLGLRPVINLKADVTFSGGNGTQSNPYMVS